LTGREHRLQIGVVVIGALSALFIVSYLAQGISEGSEYPFVVNSVAKDVLFVALAVIAVGDLRRNTWAVVLLIAAHVALIAGLVIEALFGDIHHISHTFAGPGLGAETTWIVWLAADILIVVVLSWLYESAQRERWGLRYLGNAEFLTLMALAEVLVLVDNDALTPQEVATNVDRYLASFEARGKWRVRLALFALAFYPLVTLRPPFSMMSPAARKRFVEKRFLSGVWERRMPGPLRTLVQSMIRAAQQLAFIGFYGDERGAATTGYERFSKRPGYAEKMARVDPARRRVSSLGPRDVFGDTITADAVVVGSGAGGAILAYELAARGREVLILERGQHVDPSQFTENEPHQLASLFAEGALTMSKDFRFQVGQADCVGGSTVVNNAVCFDIPERVLSRWNDPDGLNAGLDADRLRACFDELRAWLPIATMPVNDSLNPGWRTVARGVEKLGLHRPPYKFDVVDCNIADCLGCGYCNIGCAYGKKLSMLDTVLPRAQAEFGTDVVRVLAECRAERIETSDRRAHAVTCRLSDGRRIQVRANTIAVAAGAIGSSLLLAASRAGGPRVGQHLGFNIASPLTGDFEQVLNSERGLQISHYLRPPAGDGFVLETWFNPAGTQSLFMPGWFDQHRANMRRYSHMTSLGSVVGSERNGGVRRGLFGTTTLDYTPTPGDFASLLDGMALAGRIMLAAGARRVMPASFRYHEFTNADQLDALPSLLRDNSDLSVNSVHPQGGNALSRDELKGVVDEHFRVHGLDNLFVCDASVFPSPITVNPQMTVMALARYAADDVAGRPLTPGGSDRSRAARAQPGSPTVQAGVPGSG
jgi:choline dehydrogenase-like flavoprotein